jgi:hypothetical protein
MKLWAALLSAAGLAAADRVPVVVELFTSEGCSSCPPADELLIQIEAQQPFPGIEVIALSQHVDYWNRLGWRDPFSSAEYTARQQRYAQALRADNVYTPQMVVDGRVEFVGGDARRARQEIVAAARAPKVRVKAEQAAARLLITVEPVGGAPADVLLAVTEGGLASGVTRGENAGRRLRHTAVVRRLVRLGTAGPQGLSTEAPLALDPAWKRGDLRAVVLVQRRGGGPILGAAAVRL